MFSEKFCPWKIAHTPPFNRWTQKGLWNNFFTVQEEINTEWVSINETYIPTYQHASGAKNGEERAIGREKILL